MFLIGKILKIGLAAALAVLLLVFLYRILSLKKPPSFGEAMGRWRKSVGIILVVSLLGGAAGLGQAALEGESSGSVKVGFNYPNASKGLAPNGATFNVNEILSDEVLEAAIADGGLGNLSPEDLKDCLEVASVGGSGREISSETLYVSTEYTVSYKPSLKTAAYGKMEVLEPLTEAYYSYFLEKYGRKTDVLEADFSELEDLDYLDACTWLEARVSDVIAYMNLCAGENSTFVSEATGESFYSVRDRAENFRDVLLERFESYVLRYGLSRDADRYISRLNQENRLTQVDYLKNMAGYSVRLAAIDLYDRDVITPVLVPTRDSDGEFYQSRTKTETDTFADEADERLANASDEQLEIKTNNYHIEMLSAAAGGEEEMEQAEAMEDSLVAELTEISELARDTVEDFDKEQTDGYVGISYGEGNSWLGYGKRAAACACVFFLVTSAAVMAKERQTVGWRRKGRKNQPDRLHPLHPGDERQEAAATEEAAKGERDAGI